MKNSLKHPLLTLCLLILPFNIFAKEVKQKAAASLANAERLLANGQVKNAVSMLKSLADEKQDVVAMILLGQIYSHGENVELNRSEGCNWFKRAANLNAPAALHAYGTCIVESLNEEKELTKALDLFKKAAEMGHHISYCNMADIYIASKGDELSAKQSISLCEKSATMGSVPAMLRTAKMYGNVLKDYDKSGFWFLQAAQYGSAKAQYYLAEMYQLGLATEVNIESALYWFEKSASSGYLPAYYSTAKIYIDAPRDEKTGKWQENALAKAYLWLSAISHREQDADKRGKVNDKLRQVINEMPVSWREVLDERVKTHLDSLQDKPS